jgi:hypothetical protein
MLELRGRWGQGLKLCAFIMASKNQANTTLLNPKEEKNETKSIEKSRLTFAFTVTYFVTFDVAYGA